MFVNSLAANAEMTVTAYLRVIVLFTSDDIFFHLTANFACISIKWIQILGSPDPAVHSDSLSQSMPPNFRQNQPIPAFYNLNRL